MSDLASARRVVVKIGSALLVGPDGAPDGAWLSDFAADLARLRGRGQQVLVVSSGAVALGRRRLGLGRKALTLPEKQAAAAAGQSALMHAWEAALHPHRLPVRLGLPTPSDTQLPHRRPHARLSPSPPPAPVGVPGGQRSGHALPQA